MCVCVCVGACACVCACACACVCACVCVCARVYVGVLDTTNVDHLHAIYSYFKKFVKKTFLVLLEQASSRAFTVITNAIFCLFSVQ